jgi:hypothetical protein
MKTITANQSQLYCFKARKLLEFYMGEQVNGFNEIIDASGTVHYTIFSRTFSSDKPNASVFK